jgi:hypothetical protein
MQGPYAHESWLPHSGCKLAYAAPTTFPRADAYRLPPSQVVGHRATNLVSFGRVKLDFVCQGPNTVGCHLGRFQHVRTYAQVPVDRPKDPPAGPLVCLSYMDHMPRIPASNYNIKRYTENRSELDRFRGSWSTSD